MKEQKNKVKKFEHFLNENNSNIEDYCNSRNIILVGTKTNLISNMKERYDYEENEDMIYFFDNNYHFGTLYKSGRFLELRHDGSLDDYGWREN